MDRLLALCFALLLISFSAYAENLPYGYQPIPMRVIKPFLTTNQVLSPEEFLATPYVIGLAPEHERTAEGDLIYARCPNGLLAEGRYNVFHKGKAYVDPQSKEILGYTALNTADAQLIHTGDPATLLITKSYMETAKEDRLMPYSDPLQNRVAITPHVASSTINGQIIASLNELSALGQYQPVVINQGSHDGLNVGDVLTIHKSGASVVDPHQAGKLITLPDTANGRLMVFRTFKRVSYAIILSATSTVHLLDKVSGLAVM